MATRPPFFDQRFSVINGDGVLVPAAGYLLYTYESGTTTPKLTYSNQAGDAENSNPIELDTEGRCTMWLGTGEYTITLHDPDDAPVDGAQWDDVLGIPVVSADQFVPLAGDVTMEGLFELSGNATAALNPVPLQQANSLIAASAASLTTALGLQMPLGTVALWLTGSPPTKWLELRGDDLSRDDYPGLFALWGTTFGVGDGSGTFGTPDTRAEFVRGLDNGRGVDAARAIGSAQTEMIGPHTHPYLASGNGRAGGAEGGARDAAGEGQSFTTSNNAGTENRPRNIAFMLIVKALP
jgi:microcystin-dependent protein